MPCARSFDAPPRALTLAPGEIHVWLAYVDVHEHDQHQYASTLAVDERARAARYHTSADRNRFVVRRGILRRLLGAYTAQRAEDVSFTSGMHGKPALASPASRGEVWFNVAHSRGLALLAFAHDPILGVDVEAVRDFGEMRRIIDGFFSPDEQSWFHALPPAEHTREFFRVWTRKEACAKAIGAGLSLPLNTFNVASGDSVRVVRAANELQLHVESFAPADHCVAALASAQRVSAIRWWRWESAATSAGLSVSR